jgi:hypothetical protein
MELELVEPSMYLRTDDKAPERFTTVFIENFTVLSGS